MTATVERACQPVETRLLPRDGLAFADAATICNDVHGIPLTSARDVGACVSRQRSCAAEQAVAVVLPRAAELLRGLGIAPINTACLPDYGGDGAHVGDARRIGRPLERCMTATLREGSRVLEGRAKVLGGCAATVFDCLQLEDAAPACLASAASACTARLERMALPRAALARGCQGPTISFAILAGAEGAGLATLAATCAEVGVPTLASVDDWLACVDRHLSCRAADIAAAEAPRTDELLRLAGLPPRPLYCPGATTPTPTATPMATATVAELATVTPTETAVPVESVTATPLPSATPSAVATVVPTATPLPTATQVELPTTTVTRTATPTVTRTATPVPTTTRTATAVPTTTRTATPVPTTTRTATAVPTTTRTATAVPTTTRTATAVPTTTRTATAVPTTTRTATAVPTTTRTATSTPTVTRTATPVPTLTRTATPSPTATRTATRTATPVPSMTRTSAPAPTSTPGSGVCDANPAPFGLTSRVPATTCRLDGNPDQLPPLEVERVFPALSFSSPVQLTYAPDGTDRLFVVEQGGHIRVFANGAAPASASDFLTVSGVQFGGEEGLLGLAFHPRYAQNGFFYVYYSTGSPRRSVIARYHVGSNPNVADPASRVIVLEILQPYSNHNGGQLVFGADGMLYVSLGDGGSGGDPENRAQNMSELLGKILRIDVDHSDTGLAYAVPPDNPFVGQAGARGEIWALGMRNPWRMSFDRLTHALWAGDVGQGNWEEVDLIEGGHNYGWRRKEGTVCYNPSSGCDTGTLTEPLAVYSHSDGCAVTGGFVYRGSRLPELYGAYVYGDYCSGNIWALRYDGASSSVSRIVSGSGLNISSFGEDRDGELYVVNLNGTINRLRRPTGGTAGTFPRTLSATGCFSNVPGRVPAPGLVPYDVRSPLWSDGAVKRRFLMVPDGSTIGFQPTGAWDFPTGSILVKEFALELEVGNPASARALETRFLVRGSNGWQGYTYQWNDAQTEAYLLDNGTTQTFTVTDPNDPGHPSEHTHAYPSRSDCLRCHTTAAGGTLGLQTAQLNRDFDYGAVDDNQLRALEHVGFFGGCLPARPAALATLADPADATAPLAARARSYLHANCAQCHRPGGPAPTAIDLRAETSFASTGLCDALPQHGDLGVAGARIVSPGHAEDSVLWLRAALRGADQMPPLGSLVVDPLGSNLLEAWIDGLGPCP